MAKLFSITAFLLLIGSTSAVASTPQAEEVVRGFLRDVRSGENPDAVFDYFAEHVSAHQITAEGPVTVQRTPDEYARHVREFLATYGQFKFTIEELIAQNDRVFVRWRQEGHHLTSLHGEAPTGAPLIELTSVVYRVAAGRITEYWLHTDRKGLDLQLQQLVAK